MEISSFCKRRAREILDNGGLRTTVDNNDTFIPMDSMELIQDGFVSTIIYLKSGRKITISKSPPDEYLYIELLYAFILKNRKNPKAKQ